MRKQEQMAILHFAPGTSVSVTQFHEINWTVKFRSPAERLNFSHVRIDLHERTRPQERRQRVVLQTDISVKTVAEVQMLNHSDWNSPPDFHHAREQIRVIDVEGAA